MRFNKSFELAVEFIQALSSEPLTVHGFAAKHNKSKCFTQQVARQLNMAGLIGGMKGPGGGFVRTKKQINMLEVYELFVAYKFRAKPTGQVGQVQETIEEILRNTRVA